MATSRRVTFDVRITRGPHGYVTECESSYGGTYRGIFVDPLETNQVASLAEGVYRAATREVGAARPSGEPSQAIELAGGALFDALFSGEPGLGFTEVSALANRDGAALRIRMRLDTLDELAGLPWEAMYDRRRAQPVTLVPNVELIRHLGLPQPLRAVPLLGKLRILVVLSSPRDLPEVAAEAEWRALGEAMGAHPNVELVRLEPPTLAELERTARQGPWHVIHFVGHGVANPPALALTDENGLAELVGAERLAEALDAAVDLRLAVLNACHTGRAEDRASSGSVAERLLRRGVPAAVSMQFAISDHAAVAFATQLYGALSQTLPVDAAVSAGRDALRRLGPEWATPVTYMLDDGELFTAGPPAPRRARRRVVAVAAAATIAGSAIGLWALRGDAPRRTTGQDSVPSLAPGVVAPNVRPVQDGVELPERIDARVICDGGGEMQVRSSEVIVDDDFAEDTLRFDLTIVTRDTPKATGVNVFDITDNFGRAYTEDHKFGEREIASGGGELSGPVIVVAAPPQHPGAVGIVLHFSGTCGSDELQLGLALP